MALTAILLCLLIQRVFHFDSDSRQVNWFEYYYEWVKNSFPTTIQLPGFIRALIILFPPLLLFIIIVGIVYYFVGVIGYYVLTLLILWYCLDLRPLAQLPEKETFQKITDKSYQNIFATIFWLLLFGVIGVVIYKLVIYLREQVDSEPEEENVSAITITVAKVQGVLDWIPIRLLGLTYALVGHFSRVFKLWHQYFVTGLVSGREKLAECGLLAVDLAEAQSSEVLTAEQLEAFQGLINRSLLIWLVAIALFTIGMWF